MSSSQGISSAVSGVSLDTSGFVEGPPAGVRTKRIYWRHLSPFEQGHVEGLLRSMPPFTDRGREYCVQFHRLAPSTLAAIRKDCVQFQEGAIANTHTADTADDGLIFWSMRQGGYWSGFPPLTITLGDDGKVRFVPQIPGGDHE